jgi:hypothetical protein
VKSLVETTKRPSDGIVPERSETLSTKPLPAPAPSPRTTYATPSSDVPGVPVISTYSLRSAPAFPMRTSLIARLGARPVLRQLAFAALTHSASQPAEQQVGSTSQMSVQQSRTEQPFDACATKHDSVPPHDGQPAFVAPGLSTPIDGSNVPICQSPFGSQR